jgi:hypothetical protein
MQTAIRTIARYETSRPPKGKALLRFMRLAKANELLEEVEVFRSALAQEMGLSEPADSPWLSSQLDGRHGTMAAVPQGDRDFDALLLMKQNPTKYVKELRLWEKISSKARIEATEKRMYGAVDDSILYLKKNVAKHPERQQKFHVGLMDILKMGLDDFKEMQAKNAEKIKKERKLGKKKVKRD